MRGLILSLCLCIPLSFAKAEQSLRSAELSYIRAVALHYAKRYKIDHRLVLAVISVESSFRPLAKGEAGEIGLMQLHPRYFPKASYKIRENIRVGVQHLAYMRKYCAIKREFSWIICYNAGFIKKSLDYKSNSYYNKVIKEYRRMK